MKLSAELKHGNKGFPRKTWASHRKFKKNFSGKLSDVGVKQLVAINNYFKDNKVDVIYSSPLIRGKRTAQAIATATNIKTINFDDRLKEIHLGKMEGMPIDEVGEIYPQPMLLWNTNPPLFEAVGGEKMTEVYDRMKSCVFDIISKNEGKNIAIVSHGCAIRNFMSYCLGRSIDFLSVTPWVGHGTVAEIEVENGEVISVNILNIQEFI
ncbi:MAG: histidine phosphatase family protein [Oscillospiraceae bacterium]